MLRSSSHYDPADQDFLPRLLNALQFYSVAAEPENRNDRTSIQRSPLRRAINSVAAFFRKSHQLVWASIALATSFLGGPFAVVAAPLIVITAVPSMLRAWRVLRFERRLNVDFLDSAAILVSVGRST